MDYIKRELTRQTDKCVSQFLSLMDLHLGSVFIFLARVNETTMDMECRYVLRAVVLSLLSAYYE